MIKWILILTDIIKPLTRIPINLQHLSPHTLIINLHTHSPTAFIIIHLHNLCPLGLQTGIIWALIFSKPTFDLCIMGFHHFCKIIRSCSSFLIILLLNIKKHVWFLNNCGLVLLNYIIVFVFYFYLLIFRRNFYFLFTWWREILILLLGSTSTYFLPIVELYVLFDCWWWFY